MNQIVFVVPCFNEEKRLKPASFIESLSSCPDLQWLFVNDGSKDNTLGVLQGMQAGREGRIHILDLERNQGKGEAVRQGLLHAIRLQAAVTGYFDADLATPMNEILRLVELWRARSEKVILASRVFLLGRRIRRSRWRFVLGRSFATIASFLLKINIHDTQCGAKVITNFAELQSCLERPFQSRWLFDVELISRLLKAGKLKRSDFFEEPLMEWADVAGSKIQARVLPWALFDLFRIVLFSK